MRKVNYITFNDMYSGIYQSQVIDVVKYWRSDLNIEARLIAIVPIRHYWKQRKIIKSKISDARVFPLSGSISKWKWNKRFLKWFGKKDQIAVCRGPLAFYLASGIYSAVAYDGRAAVKSEVSEYDVTGSEQLNQDFIEAELNAVTKADALISVSNKLIDYWRNNLGVKLDEDKISVIPCTLTSKAEKAFETRNSANVKIVYSGGTGAWQSFELVVQLMRKALQSQPNLELLFLTRPNELIQSMIDEYPDRVEIKWVDHSKVYRLLSDCDYGILIRDDKVTNQVASPVKFAEYLHAGLQVLISPNIGDFSEFVVQNNCGVIITEDVPNLSKVSLTNKLHSKELSSLHFLKRSALVNKEYIKLFENLNLK